MDQSKDQQLNLIDRLDRLESQYGGATAQSYVRSGDPDQDPHELTFAEFVAEVRKRSNALADVGVTPSDIIAFAAPLSAQSYPMLIAGMVTATVAPLNYFLEAEALIRIVKANGAAHLLIHRTFDDGPEIVEKLRLVQQSLPKLQLLTFGEGAEVNGAVDVERIVGSKDPASWSAAIRDRPRDHILALLHTGGTTGLPKLVPHTEAMYDAAISAGGVAEGAAPSDVMMAGMPLFHTSGALQTGIVPLFNATHVVIPSSRGFRDPKVIPNYWRFVRRYGVTVGAGVPTILAALTAVEPDGPVTTFKRMVVGGAPVSKATIAKIAEITGGAEVVEGWGMTETCGFSVMNPHGKGKVGAVGLPFPGVEMQIRRFAADDETGEPCGTDETGELVVRGDVVIRHYFDHRPGSFTSDGWLRTGDLGRIDDDGYLWITGRQKDLIIRGGHNIDPAIIEEPAYQHPAVQLAAAIGRPDKYAGELPILFVQLKPGARASEQELEEFLRPRIVERAAMPKSITVLQEIPLSGPGKISKLLLRRRAIGDVFREELERLDLGDTRIDLVVVEDSLAGEVVELSWAGVCPSESLRDEIASAIDGYTISHRWAATQPMSNASQDASLLVEEAQS